MFLYSYWCAYGLDTRKVTVNALEPVKKKCNPCQSIKVGYQCQFIVRWLQLRPDEVFITCNACRHIDKCNVVCHGKDAIGKPQTFNYAPRLSEDIWSFVQYLVWKGFNATMI